jgi:CCR4-NOT transcription complex subunit 6
MSWASSSSCRLVTFLGLGNLLELMLSNNYLRALPYELGKPFQLQVSDLLRAGQKNLRELMLNNNYLRALPYELGKLFQLQVSDLLRSGQSAGIDAQQ